MTFKSGVSIPPASGRTAGVAAYHPGHGHATLRASADQLKQALERLEPVVHGGFARFKAIPFGHAQHLMVSMRAAASEAQLPASAVSMLDALISSLTVHSDTPESVVLPSEQQVSEALRESHERALGTRVSKSIDAMRGSLPWRYDRVISDAELHRMASAEANADARLLEYAGTVTF